MVRRAITLTLTLVFPGLASAATWTVDRYGSGDYTTIQDAMDASSDGDTVQVEPATYYEAIDFGGKAITVESSSGSNSTVIDASGLGTWTATFDDGEGSSCVLSGFTLRNDSYGGIYASSASPVLSSLEFDGTGSTSIDGGGMYVDGGAPSLSDCEFDDTTGYYGGAVFLTGAATLSLEDCWLESGWAYYGGGIYIDDGDVALTDCTVSDNYAYYDGAGAYLNGGASLEATDSHFLDNTGTYTDGGAIFATGATVTLDNGTLSDNGSTYYWYGYYGGAVYADGGSAVTISGATLTGNTGYGGGALYVGDGSTLAVSDSTFDGNYAYYGGAVAA